MARPAAMKSTVSTTPAYPPAAHDTHIAPPVPEYDIFSLTDSKEWIEHFGPHVPDHVRSEFLPDYLDHNLQPAVPKPSAFSPESHGEYMEREQQELGKKSGAEKTVLKQGET